MKMKKEEREVERDVLRTFLSFGVGARIVVTMAEHDHARRRPRKKKALPNRHINSFIAIHFEVLNPIEC